MTKSYAKKLSVIALSLSIAFVMLIGTAGAKNGQPGAKKGGARAKKDGAKPKANRRKGAGQQAQAKAVKALVDDLVKELGLNEEQKIKAEQLVKKHMRTITAAKGKGPNKPKAPGAQKKPKGKGKRGGARKKDEDATKDADVTDTNRF